MKIKQKIVTLVALLSVLAMPLLVAHHVGAAQCGADGDGKPLETAIINCDQRNVASKGVQGNGVWGLLLIAINILTAGVGIAAVSGLILAGITYATASNDQNKIVKAKEMIYNVVLGIVMFALMWSFLQYLIPGGVFKG